MDIQFLFPLMWLGVLGVIIAFNYLNAQSKREEIEQHLMRLGASDIQIRYHIFTFDKTNYTYSVEYTDRTGRRQQTTCKVRGGLWMNNTLYWSHEPQLSGQTIIVSKPHTGASLRSKTASQIDKVDALLPAITSQAQLYAQSDNEKDRLISELILENARLHQENRLLQR